MFTCSPQVQIWVLVGWARVEDICQITSTTTWLQGCHPHLWCKAKWVMVSHDCAFWSYRKANLVYVVCVLIWWFLLHVLSASAFTSLISATIFWDNSYCQIIFAALSTSAFFLSLISFYPHTIVLWAPQACCWDELNVGLWLAWPQARGALPWLCMYVIRPQPCPHAVWSPSVGCSFLRQLWWLSLRVQPYYSLLSGQYDPGPGSYLWFLLLFLHALLLFLPQQPQHAVQSRWARYSCFKSKMS